MYKEGIFKEESKINYENRKVKGQERKQRKGTSRQNGKTQEMIGN